MSAVVGPTLGGLFAQYLTWRWIFFVNIPLCALAAWMLIRRFHETVRRGSGAASTTWAASLSPPAARCSSSALLEGGQAWAWNSATSVLVLASGAVLIAIVIVVQRRAADPVLPLWIFSRRVLLASAVVALLVGAVAARTDHLRPDLRPGGAGHRSAGRRVRAGDPDHRLADLGRPVGPVLPAVGVPDDRADRRRAGGHRRRAVHAARPGVDRGEVGRAASWSVWAWGWWPARR